MIYVLCLQTSPLGMAVVETAGQASVCYADSEMASLRGGLISELRAPSKRCFFSGLQGPGVLPTLLKTPQVVFPETRLPRVKVSFVLGNCGSSAHQPHSTAWTFGCLGLWTGPQPCPHPPQPPNEPQLPAWTPVQ